MRGRPRETDEEKRSRETREAAKSSTERRRGWDTSVFKTVKRSMVDAFLNDRLFLTRDDAIASVLRPPRLLGPPITTAPQYILIELIQRTATQIESIWRYPQKSKQWGLARFPCKTGSDGGALLDWNPYCDVLKHVYRKIYGQFEENPATTHGNDTEKPAGVVYLTAFQRWLNRWFVEQRGYETGTLVLFGRTIRLEKRSPTDRYFAPPRARMWHLGMAIDPFNHWRGLSIDGLVTINGVPILVVEIKCPYARGRFFLYENEPMYYLPQGADGCYGMWRMFPSVAAIHRVTYSPEYGLNVDLYAMDASWYLKWYIPRELRYYFGPLLAVLAEHTTTAYHHASSIPRSGDATSAPSSLASTTMATLLSTAMPTYLSTSSPSKPPILSPHELDHGFALFLREHYQLQ